MPEFDINTARNKWTHTLGRIRAADPSVQGHDTEQALRRRHSDLFSMLDMMKECAANDPIISLKYRVYDIEYATKSMAVEVCPTIRDKPATKVIIKLWEDTIQAWPHEKDSTVSVGPHQGRHLTSMALLELQNMIERIVTSNL